MALNKVTYVDGQTIITAKNLNDIQDEIIEQGETLNTGLQELHDTYRTATAQDTIDAAQNEHIDNAEQATTATTLVPASIVTFDASAADMPLKGLTVDIEPVQTGEGDPSPENVRPITGWTGCNVTRTGKNLFDIPSGTLKVGTINKDTGVIDTSASTSRYTENMLKIKGGANYAFQCVFSGSPQAALYMAYYDSNGIFLERVVLIRAVQAVEGAWSGVVQMRDDASYIRLCGYVGVFTYSSNRQIEEGNEITDYEPYKGDTYSITFPTSAGTVYGGTLDVVNKKLTVDRASADMGDLNWEIASGAFQTKKNSLDAATGTSMPLVCSCYPYNSGDKKIIQTSANIRVMDSAYSSADDFKAAMAGQTMVFYLATPIVYDLTNIPEITTLLGENNIWADTGDVTVTYGAYLETVKAYADKVGDSILSAIAPLETSYIATRGYAVGTYLFVGTKFFKVTSAIAEGGTITPDTNVVQTTVAMQLIAQSRDIATLFEMYNLLSNS